MKNPEEEMELHIRPRAIEAVTIEIPKDTLESIEKIAVRRDMSRQALLKLYIGQGLRQDLTKMFADRMMETTAHVLARHIESEEGVSAIIQEIQREATT